MQLHVWLTLCLVNFLATASQCLGEDYYDTLGVSKDADNREIRKAFKKLILTLHPDKNQDDPQAQEKFLKVYKAYEVLKDEDLRKRYDTHGESGLADNPGSKTQYESWKFYQQNFGIYDEDPEIVTLSRSDFEQVVERAEDTWFINYYSPHCSHCHDLAPAWRELARELNGVIRIGAVNCEDDHMLCRLQGIRSYPSLVMHPKRELFQGVRNLEGLLSYALEQVHARPLKLTLDAYDVIDGGWLHNGRPWLITFCGDDGDCLGERTCTKLSAILDGLVNVATVDCQAEGALCSRLRRSHGTHFYSANLTWATEIGSLDTREIANNVLQQLPDVTLVNDAAFRTLERLLRESMELPWLLHFTGREPMDIELRKLPALLGTGLNVGRISCLESAEVCRELYIHKFPTFVVFKHGGGYEIHYGRATAHDVAAFAKDSASTRVRALTPRDFPFPVVSSRKLWFVDFFAPWCPPCMQLLPEFRKAAIVTELPVSFGTVDCTVHADLCRQYSIRSYPTTILYNSSVPHQYHGHHDAHAINEFIQDILHPPVMSLSLEQFDVLVRQRPSNVVWLVDFFAPWCGPCMQLAPEWNALAKLLKSKRTIRVGSVDCQSLPHLCSKEGIASYPTIRLYPANAKVASMHHDYQGWHRDAHSIQAWMYAYLPSRILTLRGGAELRQQVLLSMEPWLVDYYAPWCSHCQWFAPELERVAEELADYVNVAKLDCQEHQAACREAYIQAYPTVRFYAGRSASDRNPQSTYGTEIHANADSIMSFVRQMGLPKLISKRAHDEL